MISFDEKGPESLCPKHGHGWACRGRPERHRATFNRRQGVRYLVAALDVHADYLRIRPRPRRNGASTLAFMRQIRLAYPRRIRIYWIQDGLSSHWTPDIRAFADTNNIELVPTPTYASYLNRIEATFGTIDEFVCKNADYLDWDAFGHALPTTSATATAPTSANGASSKRQSPPTPNRQDHTRTQARRLNNERDSGATLREAALAQVSYTVLSTGGCLLSTEDAELRWLGPKVSRWTSARSSMSSAVSSFRFSANSVLSWIISWLTRLR